MFMLYGRCNQHQATATATIIHRHYDGPENYCCRRTVNIGAYRTNSCVFDGPHLGEKCDYLLGEVHVVDTLPVHVLTM